MIIWRQKTLLGAGAGGSFAIYHAYSYNGVGQVIRRFCLPPSVGLWGAVLVGAASGFTGAFSAVLLNGGTFSQALSAGLKGGAIGAFTAAASYGIGQYFATSKAGIWSNTTTKWTGRTLAHATVGGTASELQGGKFCHGFYSSAVSTGIMHIKGVEDYMMKNTGGWNVAGRTMVAAAIGGTAAELSGGKFADGAVTSAFQHLFNAELPKDELAIIKQTKDMVDVAFYDNRCEPEQVRDGYGAPLMDENLNPIMLGGREAFQAEANKIGKIAVGVSSPNDISKWLTEYKGEPLKTIAIIGHGNSKGVYINKLLVGDSIITTISSKLVSTGKLYLFACNTSPTGALAYAKNMTRDQRVIATSGILYVTKKGTIYQKDSQLPRGTVAGVSFYGGPRN